MMKKANIQRNMRKIMVGQSVQRHPEVSALHFADSALGLNKFSHPEIKL